MRHPVLPALLPLLLLLACVPATAQTTAFVGARVIDGTGNVLERATIVVRDGRIVAVGPDVPVPADATRVDVPGRTIMPGLVNAHGHVGNTVGLESRPDGYTRANLERQLDTYAHYGVTTVFSLGDDDAAGFALRDDQQRNGLERSRLFVAGPVIAGATAEEARAMAERVAAMHPDLLKIRVDDNLGTTRKMPEPAWRAVLGVAREVELPLAVHVFYLADARALVEAGAAFVAHSVRDVPVDAGFAKLLSTRHVCYSPTLTRELSTFVYGSTPAFADDPFFQEGVSPAIVAALKDPARQAGIRASGAYKLGLRYKDGLEVATRNLKALSDAGVTIAMGTDSGPPARFQGYFEHLELEMMVDAGLTPMQALVSATSAAARCHGHGGEFGTIAPGASADLVVLGANPLEDIRNTRVIQSVWIAGRRIR
ncbi:MAG: amidohydrolase family protein [Vicinamibacterales bacterium]